MQEALLGSLALDQGSATHSPSAKSGITRCHMGTLCWTPDQKNMLLGKQVNSKKIFGGLVNSISITISFLNQSWCYYLRGHSRGGRVEGVRELRVLLVQLLCVQNYFSIKNDYFFNDVLSSTTSQCLSCIQGPRNFPELAHKLQRLNPTKDPERERAASGVGQTTASGSDRLAAEPQISPWLILSVLKTPPHRGPP